MSIFQMSDRLSLQRPPDAGSRSCAAVIEIPEAFVQSTVNREGDRGRAWADSLPGLVDELLQRWNCIPTTPIRHGQVGIIVPVRWGDGASAVLKVSFPHPGNVHEPDAFAAWGGRGAVLLHERDDARFAMLCGRTLPVGVWAGGPGATPP